MARPDSASIPTAWSSTTPWSASCSTQLDELGIAQNTIVMYSTDNGAEKFTWPDGGTSPFRGEKNTNWEGGYRVPGHVRWPGVIKPGTVLNDIVAHEDWLPTLLAAAGEPDVKEQLLNGMTGRQQDLQGPPRRLRHHDALAGKAQSPRKEFFYFNDDGSWSACATTSGRSSSRSSGRTGLTSGRIRSRHCACQSSSTSAPTRSRSGITRRWTGPLEGRPRLPARAGAAVRGPVPGDLQGVPAAPEGGQLLARQRVESAGNANATDQQ